MSIRSCLGCLTRTGNILLVGEEEAGQETEQRVPLPESCLSEIPALKEILRTKNAERQTYCTKPPGC